METLVQQTLDSDALVDQYGDYLFRYALLNVRDRHLAEDIVQDTFLAALESYSGFGAQSSLKTWLCGILKHKIADHFRKNRRYAQFSGDDHEDAFNDDGSMVAGSQGRFITVHWYADPHMKTERAAFWQLLAKGLAELNPRAATAFTLREIEQLSTKDVCEKMQITESNLWVMLHRARRHLRKYFEGNWLGR